MALHQECLPEPLPAEPLSLITDWLGEATRARAQPNANAMVLATVDERGRPAARVVLCKEINVARGFVTFFSNYHSRKGRELAAHPWAAAVMHWDAQRRQVRLEGPVSLTSAAESDAYFASRAWQSRIGAWASQQSAAVEARAALVDSAERVAQRFGAPSPFSEQAIAPGALSIPRPAHWGGYRLWIESAELWVEGAGRLHDRARWTRALEADADGFRGGAWRATRLQP